MVLTDNATVPRYVASGFWLVPPSKIDRKPAEGPIYSAAKLRHVSFQRLRSSVAKKAYPDVQFVSRSQDTALLGLLARHEQLGHTMNWDRDPEAKIQSPPPEQITAAFRTHFDPAQISVVKAGDFKAAGRFRLPTQ